MHGRPSIGTAGGCEGCEDRPGAVGAECPLPAGNEATSRGFPQQSALKQLLETDGQLGTDTQPQKPAACHKRAR